MLGASYEAKDYNSSLICVISMNKTCDCEYRRGGHYRKEKIDVYFEDHTDSL